MFDPRSARPSGMAQWLAARTPASRLYCTRERTTTLAVIFKFPREFPADDIENRVPDAATARALVRERRPDLLALLARRRERFAPLISNAPSLLIDHAEDAVIIAFCRLAFRHGGWGQDYHHYHNENHILEILGARVDRLIDTIGLTAMSLRDWFLLSLFAASHDLRQREAPQFNAGVGSNERASIEETFRILQVCAFDRVQHAEVYLAIELMIAGSTFDARPAHSTLEFNTAELLVQSGGALAQKLDHKLDKHAPNWRADLRIEHALDLALIAADLDTANVAEPFPLLAASAERLCLEREMRSHRNPADAASALPMLTFLTEGQERYFFELHRFSSDAGRRTFSAAKLANSDKLRALSAGVIERIAAAGTPRSGIEVLQTFRQIAADLA